MTCQKKSNKSWKILFFAMEDKKWQIAKTRSFNFWKRMNQNIRLGIVCQNKSTLLRDYD